MIKNTWKDPAHSGLDGLTLVLKEGCVNDRVSFINNTVTVLTAAVWHRDIPVECILPVIIREGGAGVAKKDYLKKQDEVF